MLSVVGRSCEVAASEHWAARVANSSRVPRSTRSPMSCFLSFWPIMVSRTVLSQWLASWYEYRSASCLSVVMIFMSAVLVLDG